MSTRAELACARDGGRAALGPRVAVAEQQVRDRQRLYPAQRLLCLRGGGVERRRHDLRSFATGERVARAQRVAGEQHAVLLEVQRHVPGRMAGRGDDARAAGDIEHVAVSERGDLVDAPWAQAAVGREVPEELERRRLDEVGEEAAVAL